MIPVILAEKAKSWLKHFKNSVPTVNGFLGSVNELKDIEGLLRKGTPAVVLLGPSFTAEESLESCAAFRVERPEIGFLLLTDEVSTETLHCALRAGVQDVIGLPVDPPALDNAIRTTYARVSALANKLQVPTAGSSEEAVKPETTTVAVFSTKGGVGKTFIAVNLAAACAERSQGKRTILVDFDLQFGDAAVTLQIFPKHTAYDAVANIDRLDVEMMESFLTRHPLGFDVLVSPVQPELAELISADDLASILKTIEQTGDIVIVDMPPAFSEKELAVLDLCDHIYLVSTPDIPSIKNTKLALQTLRLLKYPPERISLVLNRADSKVGSSVFSTSKTLDMRVALQIPSDRIVPISINRGAPLVREFSKSGVRESILKLQELLLKVVPNEEKEVLRKQAGNHQLGEVTHGVH
ncbi:MAG: AAA family ATPase [Actinobacteria bacterium]|nr:AAA family ATPase [Actinomycetota bacterium]